MTAFFDLVLEQQWPLPSAQGHRKPLQAHRVWGRTLRTGVGKAASSSTGVAKTPSPRACKPDREGGESKEQPVPEAQLRARDHPCSRDTLAVRC